MKFDLNTLVALLLFSSSSTTFAHPQPIAETQLLTREQAEALDARNGVSGDISDLWKRKGGGGGGGKGGSGGSSSGGSSGGSSSSSGKSGYVGSSLSSSRGSTVGGAGNLVSTSPSIYGGDGSGSGRGNSGSRSGSSCVCSLPEHSGCTGIEVDDSSLDSQSYLDPRFTLDSPGSIGADYKNSANKTRSSGKGSSSSNTGGQTKTGSGVAPAYGGGRYYGGGSTKPYSSGGVSPAGIVAVPLLVGAGALALYPGYHLWPYGAYAYPYYHPYGFYNRTARRNATNSTNTRRDMVFEMIKIRQSSDTGVNETKPVTCLCAMYEECGCDDDGNSTFLNSIIGDGTYSQLNLSLVDVADVNGTSTIIINGTLPNGTTASGGTEDANGAGRMIGQASGYWVMVALVVATVYMV